MKQKIYKLKIKVLKSKIKANEKLEIVEQIFKIEQDLTINYSRILIKMTKYTNKKRFRRARMGWVNDYISKTELYINAKKHNVG